MKPDSRKRRGLLIVSPASAALFSTSQVMSHTLMPVYDKPLIYYPLSTLMLAGVRDVLLISTPEDSLTFQHLLGNGHQWGINIQYAAQPPSAGTANSFVTARHFLQGAPCAVVLGDHLFHGHDLVKVLSRASSRPHGATVFAHHVQDAPRYAIVEFDAQQRAVRIKDSPDHPDSHYALTGLSFFDSQVCDMAADFRSASGPFHITELYRNYLRHGQLHVEVMGRGFAWLDASTPESLHDASGFISTLQRRQGQMVACPEEIAYLHGWIGPEDLDRLAQPLAHNGYGQYLLSLLNPVPQQ
jgi:glucose-1-phosphate thymidylyltransferase